MLVEGLLKHLAAPRFFALELLNGCANILNGWRLLVFGIADDGLELGIYLKCCFAARAAHFHQFTFSFGHTADISRFQAGSPE